MSDDVERAFKDHLRAWVAEHTTMTGERAAGMVDLLYDAMVVGANPEIPDAHEHLRHKHNLNERELRSVMHLAGTISGMIP